MMKAWYKYFFVCVCFAIVSCSEEPEVFSPQTYKIITGNNKKTWKVTKLEWTGEGKSDLAYTLPVCLKDDLYIFYANSERLYEVTNGATKCSSGEPDKLVSDQWSFVNANSTLTIIMPWLVDFNLPFYVKKLNTKEMILEIYLDQDNIYSYRITMQSVSEE